ncbi:unnamed protein product [Brassica rapa subsp. narinosa]
MNVYDKTESSLKLTWNKLEEAMLRQINFPNLQNLVEEIKRCLNRIQLWTI